ncbi:MAG TPA: protein kinase, partial [Fimbriimonadaceae bacterium]|nr:protein kinase [Fimbriimonadaceae bacterium]
MDFVAMASAPTPLPAGTVLGGRFEIESVLGRGGFGTAYLAHDRSRGDRVVVKELAPDGAVREASGLLDLDPLGAALAYRLRRAFLDEAKLLARLNIRGVVNVRTHGTEAGSAYFVTDYFPDAEPLDDVLKKGGRMAVDGALDIAFQLMETLEAVHRRGILHRDIKPANVLLRQNGDAMLIDFGSAREWHADMTEHQTVLYTPGFAPLEQLSEHAKRGPATDIYGLAALLYTLLAGSPPPAATDRLNGLALPSLGHLRPEVEPVVAQAIESGLALHYAERPQSVAEFKALFEAQPEAVEVSKLDAIDAKLAGLQHLHFGRRECPACGDVLHIASPLPRGRCPVCDHGALKPRNIPLTRCAACRLGVLRKTPNVEPRAICPLCDKGILARRRAKLLSKDFVYACGGCGAHFAEHEGQVILAEAGSQPDLVGRTQTWAEWSADSKRSTEVQVCDGCQAQFDLLPDGQWQQIDPKPGVGSPSRLYPEEWARVAAGLDPGCGTHVCSSCEADYYV